MLHCHGQRNYIEADVLPTSTAKHQLEYSILIAKVSFREKKEKKTSSYCYISQWLARRPDLEQYGRLMKELENENSRGFRNFLRMDDEMYQEILSHTEHRMKPNKLKYREPLSPDIKLAIMLRYLSSGDSYYSLMYECSVSHNTISLIKCVMLMLQSSQRK